jgi:ribA/ribD-fused uncharacterized protein
MTIQSFTGKYGWLSNFEACVITYTGVMYATTEHAYQAQKTRDPMWHAKIASAVGPRQAKFYGRQCPMRPDWDKIKDGVMLDVTRLKYAHRAYREALLNTGDVEIIEGNYWNDTYWGVCNGVGQNKLGKIIMHVRDELRSGQMKIMVA